MKIKKFALRCFFWLIGLLLCLLLAGCGQKLTYTIQAGSDLPDPEELGDMEGLTYDSGYDPNCVNHAGTYELTLTDGAGKKYVLKLTVKDTKKPVVVTRHVYYALGTENPNALDFINTIEEADDYTAYFTGKLPDMTKIGDYDVSFCVKDASGNVSEECHSIMTVVEDTSPPVFDRVPELSAYVGEAIAYRKGLVVTDNCSGTVQVEVDASQVKPEVPGDYTVSFKATDTRGNVSTAQTVIHIYENQITEAQLFEKIEALSAEITTSDMTVEQKLRAAHAYIQENIAYTSDSDKSDWVRAAYDSLFVTGSGDCFNYFAAAKAFLIYYGVDYREIERTPGVEEGTHFWLMVNLGTHQNPRWYHYDATRLRNTYENSGCFITDKQMYAYNRMAGMTFYAYNASAYPATSTEIITPTPTLQPYY
ncbi:MAG: transglutaminase domain-containing protein [Ruminococcaceae bacterium]|nr:transglutaminase domain-containing protein [Oscillospiraceae bacterium]